MPEPLEDLCGVWTIRWENPTRYYQARLTQDLFGDWVVSGCYGGRFNRLGQNFCRRVPSYADDLRHIRDIDKMRQSHGYSRVT